MYDALQVIAGQRGSRLVTSAKTNLRFRAFQANGSTTISALKSVTQNTNGEISDPADVLESHIEGSGSTTLEHGTIIVCQQSYFTDITPSSGSVNLVL